MTIRGPVEERVSNDTMRQNIGVGRWLLVVVAAALMTAACGSGSLAPVVDRSTAGAGSDQSAGASGTTVATAGSEVAETDWTATVRPLGDSGDTASRALPSQASAPASTPNSQAGAPTGGGASSTTVNAAVVSLLNTANAQSRAGDHARAAATLERAIAIEPNNAWLWHRLADTRLKEGRLEQAAGLVAKSNSLANSQARADRSLQADNWKLVAEVRRRQGDAGAAAAAESRAAELSN